MKKYSIVIPTYNHCDDLLKPCLESIFKYTNLEEAEIIVSANGCKDNTKEYLESLSDRLVIVWNDEALGYSKATNEGIKVASTDKIVLLNNDVILLSQPRNQWLELLDEPFNNSNTGITCVSKTFSEPANSYFAIFFCVMIHRKVFDKIGLLNEEYGVGGGEDTEFSIEAIRAGFTVEEVTNKVWSEKEGLFVGSYPIYHKGEGTVHDSSLVSGWNEIFKTNSLKLAKKYNPEYYKYLLSNHYERAVFLKGDKVFPREFARYRWASNRIVGRGVLDVGCSTGYGCQYLPKKVNYFGMDLDSKIIEVAKEQQWRENAQFFCDDIMKLEDDITYGTIIAFEVIEHLDDPWEAIKILKRKCTKLLVSVPYKEPKGFWGEHHKIHNIDESFFPNGKFRFINENGNISNTPEKEVINLMLVELDGDIELKNETVLCSVSTKGRYFSTLPLTLMSIINQTKLPDHLVIFDDNSDEELIDLRTNAIYHNLFYLMDVKGLSWEVIFGEKKGQHYNHQKANLMKYDWVWRVDDDLVPDVNVLENLYKEITREIGCIGGEINTPSLNLNITDGYSLYNSIDDLFTKPNRQLFPIDYPYEVEHLHCSFLYRAGVCDYNLKLSPVAHREETLFSYEFVKKGYKNIIIPDAVSVHLKAPSGGIRTGTSEMFEHDERIFLNSFSDTKLIVLNNGIGDHIVFRSILPEIMNKHKKVIIACCYPEVFRNDKVEIISISDAEKVTNLDEFNIYKKMIDWNWKESLEKAFRKLYL